jgi:hypothetical protein
MIYSRSQKLVVATVLLCVSLCVVSLLMGIVNILNNEIQSFFVHPTHQIPEIIFAVVYMAIAYMLYFHYLPLSKQEVKAHDTMKRIISAWRIMSTITLVFVFYDFIKYSYILRNPSREFPKYRLKKLKDGKYLLEHRIWLFFWKKTKKPPFQPIFNNEDEYKREIVYLTPPPHVLNHCIYLYFYEQPLLTVRLLLALVICVLSYQNYSETTPITVFPPPSAITPLGYNNINNITPLSMGIGVPYPTATPRVPPRTTV